MVCSGLRWFVVVCLHECIVSAGFTAWFLLLLPILCRAAFYCRIIAHWRSCDVCSDVWWFWFFRWFVVVCGGLRWFAVICGGLSFSHTPAGQSAWAWQGLGLGLTQWGGCTFLPLWFLRSAQFLTFIHTRLEIPMVVCESVSAFRIRGDFSMNALSPCPSWSSAIILFVYILRVGWMSSASG